jgi:spermidine synthase
MILHRASTKYNEIVVTRRGDVITLWSPADIKQTAINVTVPALPHLEYARNTLLGVSFRPRPEKVLVIGLGGGSIPLMYAAACKGASIDAVEIDPVVVKAAKITPLAVLMGRWPGFILPSRHRWRMITPYSTPAPTMRGMKMLLAVG